MTLAARAHRIGPMTPLGNRAQTRRSIYFPSVVVPWRLTRPARHSEPTCSLAPVAPPWLWSWGAGFVPFSEMTDTDDGFPFPFPFPFPEPLARGASSHDTCAVRKFDSCAQNGERDLQRDLTGGNLGDDPR